ncbi:MAG: hypothetical protein EZS28_030265, partial [Streblomastix strix]
IVDSQITDYWWDGTQLRELQTYQPDLSNVVSSLGTATGGGNAITDLSLTGNILIPAKNKSFVDVDNDQSITGQKSFTTTIHSVGITYQDYNNSNVILAGGGVRAIADIQSASYSKAEDDSKLTLMTDKIELIDAYTKTESDSKFVDMTTDQTIGGNIIFNLEVRAPNSKLPGYSSDYVVMSGAMNNKSHFELTDEVDQTVAGIKIFSNNITAPAFIKSDGTNQQVLLANGTTKPLSEFTTTIDDSNYVNKMVMFSIQSGFNLQKYRFSKIGDVNFLYLDASVTTDKSNELFIVATKLFEPLDLSVVTEASRYKKLTSPIFEKRYFQRLNPDQIETGYCIIRFAIAALMIELIV